MIQPMHPRTARELKTRRSGLWCARIDIGKQQRTVPAARYATPSGVLIAPRYRSDFDLGTSQVHPLEAAEPESAVISVPL